MEGRHLIAEGTYDGLAWVSWARQDQPREGDLLSMIRITDAGGRILHGGGTGGRPLDPGQLLKISTGGSDEGPRVLLGRVHPDVQRLVLTTAHGDELDVPLYGHPDVPGIRFAAMLLPRDVVLDSVAGLGAGGRELERLSLKLQQGQWESRRR
jgi:hypothetical protein